MGLFNKKDTTDKPLKPAANRVVSKAEGKRAGPQVPGANMENQAHGPGDGIKELTCLYGLARLIEEEDNSLEDIFKGLPGLIPAAWQYPDITCARLVVQDKEFTTPNWQETAWKQTADIHVNGVPSGRLEVCYLEQTPDSYEGPFLKRERDLVNAIAQRLGKVMERQQLEGAILRSKLLLQSVIDATPDFIYVKDLEHRFMLVNRSFAQSQNLIPQDMIGRPDTDFFSEELCLGNPGKGIVGFHADDLQVFQGRLVQNPRNLVTWADGSLHIYDTYKIPLHDQSGKIYAAMVFSRDSTERQKAEERGDADRLALQRTLQAAIDIIVEVVEIHDPITVGHQTRVADLAAAIARDMQLDDSRIENLTMAAKIHDIGKVYVPTDMLSKPGKLTDMQFSTVVTHAQAGSDMLLKAGFPQSVATIVLQHHERLDGSGYPNELKGGQLQLESRILAVADVVEAITSNRPYRPAFVIDNALDEIANNRATLYDPDAVDACLRLFKDKGYKFES
jgi:putative nucleotidyltransferase with HDIG domain/PAS domain S-box-containing protein